MRLSHLICSLALLAGLTLGAQPALAQNDADETPVVTPGGVNPRDAAVKIFSTIRRPDLVRPWTKTPPQDVTGTGFVIVGDRILTNAHVVANASQIFVQPPRSSDKLRAEVVAIATGIDLAVLQLSRESDREKFFANHPALPLEDALPEAGEMVKVYGYPMGGEQLSVTEGVVSRVEYSAYYNDAAGVRIQVDAALNPGNSGGPALAGDKVIGVVFSHMPEGENIGFVIPTEEVERFLDDVADGRYEGPPRNFDSFQTLENPALREKLGVDESVHGLVVNETFGEDSDLKRWDILVRVGDYDVDNAGLVTLRPDLRLAWQSLIPDLAEDGVVPGEVVREGERVPVKLHVSESDDSVMDFLADADPDYFIYGPLVFTPAYIEHFRALNTGFLALKKSPIAERIGDTKDFDDEQLVIVPGSLLPHPVSKGYEISYFPTLKSVNGVKIKNLAHLVETLRDLKDDYVTFEFYDNTQEILVFDRQEIEDSTEEILEDNSIRRRMSPALEPIWEGKD
ncbi:MAG: trypsin-like peptidase domain-containing protein [Phycisphaerales bacterium]